MSPVLLANLPAIGLFRVTVLNRLHRALDQQDADPLWGHRDRVFFGVFDSWCIYCLHADLEGQPSKGIFTTKPGFLIPMHPNWGFALICI